MENRKVGRPKANRTLHQKLIGFTADDVRWINERRGLGSTSAFVRSLVQMARKSEEDLQKY